MVIRNTRENIKIDIQGTMIRQVQSLVKYYSTLVVTVHGRGLQAVKTFAN